MELDRMSREEAAAYVGCGISTLDRMRKQNLMEGTFYTFGKRVIYITDALEAWMQRGGELAAYERINGIAHSERKDEDERSRVIAWQGRGR